MSSEIHMGDVGTIFRVTVYDGSDVVDLSSVDTKQILLRKPNKAVLTCAASFYTDGSDGIIQYTTQTSELDKAGLWSIQAYVAFSDSAWHTSVDTFKVYNNLS